LFAALFQVAFVRNSEERNIWLTRNTDETVELSDMSAAAIGTRYMTIAGRRMWGAATTQERRQVGKGSRWRYHQKENQKIV
jgi:hypothetical protein